MSTMPLLPPSIGVQDLATAMGFSILHQLLFFSDPRIRYTLFLPDSATETVRPVFRFQVAAGVPSGEALKSRVSFQRGEGAIGQAWEKPGTFIVRPIEWRGVSGDRESYVKYKQERERLRPATADSLSATSQRTQLIVAYGYPAPRNRRRFLGGLSVDFQLPVLHLGELEGVASSSLADGKTRRRKRVSNKRVLLEVLGPSDEGPILLKDVMARLHVLNALVRPMLQCFLGMEGR